MLNSIYIDGYRNLKNLKIDFRPSLNVLIGANGVGKSNIIEAIYFFTRLLSDSLNHTPLNVGVSNIRNLFHQNANDLKISPKDSTENLEAIFDHNDVIHFRVEGTSVTSCLDISQPRSQSEQGDCQSIKLRTKYVYNCKIGLELQKLEPLLFLSQNANFQFSVEDKAVGNIDLDFSGPRFKVHQDTQYLNDKIDNRITMLINSLNHSIDSYEFNSLFTRLGECCYPIKNIINEIGFSHPLELSPNLIRNEMLEMAWFGIERDGRGLFSTLAHMHLYNKEKFDEVVGNFKAIFSDVIGVEVEMANQHEIKKINVNLSRNNDTRESIPIQLISDGYLKWFSFVTALSLTDNNIIIDEPENFIDTTIQSEFPEYLRDEIENKGLSCFLTTHSETLVNYLKPDEIILVDSPAGFARARRIDEIERLKKNMYISGFPLGWYFHTGSLELYCGN